MELGFGARFGAGPGTRPNEGRLGRYAAICKAMSEVGGSLAGFRISGKRGVDSLDEMQATDDGCGRRTSTWVWPQRERLCEWAMECLSQWRVGLSSCVGVCVCVGAGW